MFRTFIFISALLGATLACGAALSGGHEPKLQAEPWSFSSLNEAFAKMPSGDVNRGQLVHEQMMCNACHGETGQSPSRNYASLNGQTKEYTIKMLMDYRDGRRWENYKQANIMVKISEALSDQQIADLAAFYAKQPLTSWTLTKSEKADHTTDATLKALATTCTSCHGEKGQGNQIVPAIAGQVPEYVIRTLKAYKNKTRTNDIDQTMAQFTYALTDDQIENLAKHFATLELK